MRFSDRYTTKKLLHQNSRVEIYAATDSVKSQDVVIKALRTELLNPYEISRFRKEFSILKSIDHEGVVKAIDYYEGHRVYLVLEYIDGKPLSKYITDSGIELSEFMDIACQCLKALEHIHISNVIHKDINPSNVIWNPETKKATIIDFNISEVVSHESQGFCNPDNLQGTLGYISPEQTGRMNRTVDYRTDLYSLGVTFYKMVTGTMPFESRDPLEIIHSHIAREPVPPIERKDIPKIISDIIVKLMSKNAEDRYQNAFGLMADLEECLERFDFDGRIESFNLGRHDISSRFIIPQKLFGREEEIKQLISAFERVSGRIESGDSEPGQTEIMLVIGAPGIGKSALINEINKPVIERGGYFLSGKYEQFRSDTPYSAIIHAFQKLLKQIYAY